MRILEQGLVLSAADISRLNIIDWTRLNGLWQGDVAGPYKILDTWLSNHAMYTVIEQDLKHYPERDDWSGWHHSRGHEYLGRLYWNMFHACFVEDGNTLTFADAPDFSGTLVGDGGEVHRFWGDIGRVSASAFVVEVLPHVAAGDLWITLQGECQQVVIEFQAAIGQALKEGIARVLGLRK